MIQLRKQKVLQSVVSIFEFGVFKLKILHSNWRIKIAKNLAIGKRKRLPHIKSVNN